MLQVIGILLLAGIAAAQGPHASSDRRVEIPSDGWRLIGTFAPAAEERAPTVLLLNGAARDRRAYVALARELAARGIASLRLDLRGEGESTNLGRFEPGVTNALLEGTEDDVAAAIAWLRARADVDAGRIGVLGASYSAEAMAAAARAGSKAGAYVALSPGSFSDQSAGDIDSSGAPWWFIASRDERFAQAVVAGIPDVSRTAKVTIVSGNAHASDILSPHFILNEEIADWFAARLRRHQAPALWGALPHGPFAVGYRTMRPSDDAALRIDVWYPAAATSTPLRFGDYLREADDLRDMPAGFPRDNASLVSALGRIIGSDAIPARTLEEILASPMAAGRDVAAAGGRFPLVLWTPRYGTTVMQAVLNEFLASHGVIVAFARREGDPARLPFELEGAGAKARELERRVGDMRAALAALTAEPSIDTQRIGVLAWSYTGEMATMLQQREPRVTLVAGLSTTLVNDWVFAGAPALDAVDPARLGAAYAVITQPRESRPAMLSKLGTAYYVEVAGTAHGSFNAAEGHLPSLLGIRAVHPWSVSSDDAARGYEAAAIVLLRLVRRHVAVSGARALRPVELAAGHDERLQVWSR